MQSAPLNHDESRDLGKTLLAGDPAYEERADEQDDRPVEQDLAPKPLVHVRPVARAHDEPERREDRGRLHYRGHRDHVAFIGDARALQDRRRRDEGHDGDRAVMRRHRRRVEERQPRQDAQVAEGHEGQQERQDHPRDQRAEERRVHAMRRDARAALEADREEQVDRQPLRYRLGDRQVRPREGGGKAQHEGQDDRRDQVVAGQRQDVGHRPTAQTGTKRFCSES